MKVAIIGGGISGIATAFYILKQEPQTKITIFEKMPQLGGKMKTKEVEGFFFEEGSNGFLSNKPDTLELIKLAGCEDILLRSDDNARIRYIYKEALHRLPESAKAFIQTPLLSLKGKLRVAWEYFTPAKKDTSDETLQSFGYRRVGKEMTDVFLDAMVAGIFASTPDKISVLSAFPAVVKLEQEYGGLFRGMIAKKKKEAGPGGVLMSFEKGVSTFIQRLTQAMNAQIRTNTPVRKIEKKEGQYVLHVDDSQEYYDKVVLATPAYESADMIVNLDEELAKDLKDIEYSPISVVGLGYEELSHPLKGFGLLTTTCSKKDILGVLWDSSIFQDRAPLGKKALRVMIGGQRNPNLALKNDDELIQIAKKGLEQTMGIYEVPSVTYVKKYARGIPNYKVGHQIHMRNLFQRLQAHKGLFLSANAYFGVSLNDCVKNAKKVAYEVIKEGK